MAFNVGKAPVGVLARALTGNIYVEKSLQSLDSLLDDNPGFLQSEFLKLDVQGYELEVLKGASKLLSHVEFVYLEASLIQVNSGCPDILEVLNFMRDKGFKLIDFCSQTRRKDGALWQADLLFVSNKSDFVPSQEYDGGMNHV